MKARILRHEEWGRLDGQGLSSLLPFVEPQNIAVVVVEDTAGEIVACLSAIQVTHLEGTWVAPKYRGNAGVMRALLRQAFAVPEVRGEHWAFGSVMADGEPGLVDGFLRRLGGQQMPVRLYALPLGGH